MVILWRLVLIVLTVCLVLQRSYGQTTWDYVSLFPPILGEKFQLGCFNSDAIHYKWFIDGNEPSGVSITTPFGGSLLTINSFTKQFIGEYKCRAILNGSQDEIDLYVTSQNYTLDITGDTQIIEGNPLQLQCVFMSEDRSVKQYKWKVADTTTSQEITLSGQNSSTLHITSPSKQHTLYTCEVIVEPTDLVLSVSTSVSIFSVPTVIGPSTITYKIQKESNITLVCNITDIGVSYKWMFQGSLLISDNTQYFIETNTLTLFNTKFTNTGNYTCSGENLAGNSIQNHIVTIFGAPEITSSIDKHSYMLIEGHPLILSCPVLSYPSPNIEWTHLPYNDNSFIIVDNTSGRFSFGDNNSLVITSLNINDNGLFKCNASNEYGFVTIQHSLTVYGIPSPPENLDSINIEAESYTLSWQHSSVHFTSPDYYRLEISEDNGLTFSQYPGQIPSNVTMTTISDLIPNTSYVVRVIAVNKVGSSSPSNEMRFTTLKSAPKLSYFNVTALNGGRSLLLKWKLLYTGGSPVISFNITLTSSNSLPITISSIDLRSGSVTITGLEPSTSYTINVHISNAIGTRLNSVAITTSRGPPGKPTKPLVDNIKVNSVQLSFTLYSLGSEPLTNYIINVSNEQGTISQMKVPVTNQPSSGENISVTVQSLNSGSIYSFSVAGESQIGTGVFSDYSNVVRTDDGYLIISIIGSVVGGTFICILAIIIVCIVCILRKKRHTKHTITRRGVHITNDSIFPSSSISDNNTQQIGSEEDTPPTSVIGLNEDSLSPFHRQRTQSVSSTNSSHVFASSCRDMVPILPLPVRRTSPYHDPTDSAYGGSAEKVSHLYAEIGNKNPAFFSNSAPSINRIIYDIDRLPPKIDYATDV